MANVGKYKCLICITLCILVKLNNCQRLSQGASDWYMRFHSNFRHVKRDVDPPEIKTFLVSSTINVSIRIAVSKLFSPFICLGRKYLSELIKDVFYFSTDTQLQKLKLLLQTLQRSIKTFNLVL